MNTEFAAAIGTRGTKSCDIIHGAAYDCLPNESFFRIARILQEENGARLKNAIGRFLYMYLAFNQFWRQNTQKIKGIIVPHLSSAYFSDAMTTPTVVRMWCCVPY